MSKAMPDKVCKFSHKAMNGLFEIFIAHEDNVYSEQAAGMAFDELDRLEGELSKYIENSEVSRINALGVGKCLKISLDMLECLKVCNTLYGETAGAFDIAFGSSGRLEVGIGSIRVDAANLTLEVLDDGVVLDLGGFAKGYAIDKMKAVLEEWEIDSGLLHGGFSSVLAIGDCPGGKGWPVTMSSPASDGGLIANLRLKGGALGASGLKKGQHIIDPRSGKKLCGIKAAWAGAENASVADGLSTAFMIMSDDEIGNYCRKHSERGAVIVEVENGKVNRRVFGKWEEATFV
jgi:thiamine biosynthesis lipoprotein